MASANEIDTSNNIDINFVPIIFENTESGDKSRTPCQDISRLNKQYEQKCEGSNMTKGTSFSSDSEFPPILNRSKKSTYSRRKICKTELIEENDAEPNDSSVCQLVDIKNIILSLQNTTELPDSTLNDNSQESVENVSRIRVSTNLFDTESFEPSVQTSVPYSSEFIKMEIDPLDLNNIDLLDQAAVKAVLPRKGNNNYELNELLDQQVVGNISYTNTNCIESENSAIPMQLIRHIPGTIIRRNRNAPYVSKEPKFYLPRVVVCDICDLDFIGKSLLNTHLRFVHRPWALEIINEVYCPQCKAWFDDEFKFKVHFPCYKKAVRIHCPLCYMENPMLEHYDLHNVMYRSGNFLWCKLCDTPTRYTVAELNEHRQTEHKHNGVFECLECKVTFASYGEIKVHSQQHDTENTIQRAIEYKLQLKEEEECKETFKCDICDREFKQNHSLANHKRSHDKALCSVCGLSFRSNSLLLEHQNKHFKSQTYTCEECGKEFNQRKYLTQHLRIHKVKKMFECEICNITFTQQTSLIYHMATHTNEDIFKCTLCDIKFDKQSKLSSHMRFHNENGTNPNQCQICKKYFAHNCNLIVHMRMHPEWKKEDSVKEISTSEQEKENKNDKVNKKEKVTVFTQKGTRKSKARNKK
ncbi:uncharacterized protein CBL_04356 [Carabus blaptoides fortunei]